MQRALFLLFILLLAVGCRACSLPDRHVQRDVTAKEVVGTWELTAGSLELLWADGYAPEQARVHRITIGAGDAVEFASAYSGFDGTQYVAASGSWELGPRARVDDPEAPSNVLYLVLDTPKRDTHFALGIADEDGRLLLWTYHDDPDLWQFLEYERLD